MQPTQKDSRSLSSLLYLSNYNLLIQVPHAQFDKNNLRLCFIPYSEEECTADVLPAVHPRKRPLATPMQKKKSTADVFPAVHPENGLWPPRKRPLATPNSVSSEIIELAPRIIVSERSVKDVPQARTSGMLHTLAMIRDGGIPQGGSISLVFYNFFNPFSIVSRSASSLTHSS